MPADQLEIAVAEEKKNELLGRSELRIQVKHIGQPTPTREVLRKEVGRVSKVSPERVYVRRIVTDYGAGISECIVNVYDTQQRGEAIEEGYMRKRNAPLEENKKETAPPTVQAQPAAPPEASAAAAQETQTAAAPPQPEAKAESAEKAAKPQIPKSPKKRPPKEKSAEPATSGSEKKES